MRALRLLTHILDSKTASFAPAGFRDRYEEALLAHLRAKQAGLPPQPQQSLAVPPAGAGGTELGHAGHAGVPLCGYTLGCWVTHCAFLRSNSRARKIKSFDNDADGVFPRQRYRMRIQ
jgi:hypothetical protein